MYENMPEKMLVHRGKKQDTFYYRTIVNGKRKKINLGHHYPTALKKISEIEFTGIANPKIFTLQYIWGEYSTSEKGLLQRPPGTQEDYARAWNKVGALLGQLKLEDIKTYHLNQYLERRTAKVRANRELALVSILINWAIKYRGYTGDNPCSKNRIEYNPEKGRSKYITKHEYEELYAIADDLIKNAMDLLLFTGQRPQDVVEFKFSDIKKDVDLRQVFMNGVPASEILGMDFADTIHVEPQKIKNRTNKKIDLVIEGELKNIIDRITKQNRMRRIPSLYLLCDEKGMKLERSSLSNRFHTVRKKAGYQPYELQLRDLRRKNSVFSTSEDAKERLGHSSTSMTEHYRNNVMSVLVRPIPKLY